MSLSARIWARDVALGSDEGAAARFTPSMLRHLLKEVADFDQGTGEVYAYISTLVRYTDMDRKTVSAYLAELVRRGLLKDTGKRVGRTKQTPIYRLVGFVPDFSRGAVNPNSTAGGMLSENSAGCSDTGSQTSVSAEEIEDGESPAGAEEKRVPSAGLFVSGRVPPTVPVPSAVPVPPGPGKEPAGDTKEARRPPPNSYLNSTELSDARAPARGGARTRAREPDQPTRIRPTPEQVRQYWHAQLHSVAETEVHMLLWQRGVRVGRTYPTWPPELQDVFRSAVTDAVDRFSDLEIQRGSRYRALEDQGHAAVRENAAAAVQQYLQVKVEAERAAAGAAA